MIVDSAVYAGGRRTTPSSLEEAYRSCQEPGKFAWVTLYEPTEEEFVSAAEEFRLHETAVEDAVRAHQRPRLERYGDCLFAVLKTARYLGGDKGIQFGEVYAFVGEDYLITVRHGEGFALDEARRRIEGEPDRLRRGTTAVFYEIMYRIVEGYSRVVEGLENDVDGVEERVFEGDAGSSRRIHDLSREVIQFHQATKPLVGELERLEEGVAGDPGARRYLRRVRDRVLRTTEQIEGLRDVLSSILGVNLTMVGVDQNNQMQKISAWGAILVVPTLIAGIFGMNFEGPGPWTYLKEQGYGFEISVALMALIAALLYVRFKRSGWL